MTEEHPSHNCPSSAAPPAWSRQREIQVCPPHHPIKHSRHHPPHFSFSFFLSQTPSSVTHPLFICLQFFLPTFHYDLLHPFIPSHLWSKDFDPTWSRETLEGYISVFPEDSLQRRSTNRLEKQRPQSLSFPHLHHFLSLSLSPDISFSCRFHLIPLCPLPCFLLWNV